MLNTGCLVRIKLSLVRLVLWENQNEIRTALITRALLWLSLSTTYRLVPLDIISLVNWLRHMHFLEMSSSLRVYLCTVTPKLCHIKALYLWCAAKPQPALLVTRSELRRFLHILFSASHLSSHRTQTLSLCDRYSRGAGDTHTQSRHQNCQVSGVCFYLVIILQFSHLGFFFFPCLTK